MRVGIIGAGPAGSVAGATLARQGHAVELFEQSADGHPVIAECLLPGTLPLLERIGVTRPILSMHQALPANGAFFEQVGSGRSCRFPFNEGLPEDPAIGAQIDRSTLDRLLLDRATAHGATVHRPVRILRVDLPDQNRATPVIQFSRGSSTTAESVSVDFLIDASGRQALLASQLGLIERDGGIKRAAVFGRTGQISPIPGAQTGDMIISKAAQGWAWSMPGPKQTWSVGIVMPRDPILSCTSPAEAFSRNIAYFPELQARLGDQVPSDPRITPNLNFSVRQRLGPAWALVGDAGGCNDPIFSSGVFLAIRSALTLAEALIAGATPTLLEAWSQAASHDVSTFANFAHLWYDGHLIDNLFFGNPRDPHVMRGITSLLDGNTTSRENHFLAMIRRRTLALRHKTLIMN